MQAAFWFSVLLNLKHIYLYIAPVYFVYLFRSYCIENQKSGNLTFHFGRLIKLGLVVASTFIFTYGPFMGHIQQVVHQTILRYTFNNLLNPYSFRFYPGYFLSKIVVCAMLIGHQIFGPCIILLIR